MDDPAQLSDLQLAILRILWDGGEATVADVHGELARAERELAPTTVATMLTRLERRGFVEHRVEGRQYVYRAAVLEPHVRQSALLRLMQQFFRGDPAALVGQLIRTDDFDSKDLADVRRLLADAEATREEEDHE